MAELPTFITAYFGALIIGVGYLGLWFKYKIDNRNFYELKAFDKTMQSLMLGMISFLITFSCRAIMFLDISLKDFSISQSGIMSP